jgi:hypothetical protein
MKSSNGRPGGASPGSPVDEILQRLAMIEAEIEKHNLTLALLTAQVERLADAPRRMTMGRRTLRPTTS